MVPVLIAGLIAMVAAVVIGPKFIELLRSRNLGQQIRAEGPATHAVKQGTPTMGGLLILASAVVPFLFLSQYTAEGLTVLFMVLGCALIGFTDDYLKLRRSPVMKPVDDADVWSIVCTYVAKEFRGRGLQHRLLAAGLDFARSHGVRLVEAYPVDKAERSHDDFMFFGSRSLYERAGFREVVRRSPTRVVMRRTLRPRR